MSRETLGKESPWRAVLMVLLAFTLGLATVVPSTALAEEQPMSQLEALQLIRGANDAFEERRFEEAYEKYQRAYEVLPEPSIRYRMGQTAQELGLFREAIAHYEAYRTEGEDQERLELIERVLPELRAQLPGVLVISSSPSGATVTYRHGEEELALGVTPGEFEVPAGEGMLRLSLEGHESKRQNVGIEAGEREEVSLELARTRTSEPLDEQSGANVFGITGWTALGLGAAGLAAGGFFSLQQATATQLVNEYDKREESASREELEELRDDAMGHFRMARVAYISGGVLAAIGAGLLVYDRTRAGDDRQLSLDGGVSPDGGYVVLRGRF